MRYLTLELIVATHTFVDFEDPEGLELSRLASIRQDLESAVRLCEYLRAKMDGAPNGWPASEITDAFSTAIVIRYNRAFVTGARHGLRNEEISVLSEEQLAEHERLRALRDKHYAHSVNSFEDTRVQARYCLERVKDEGITSVSVAHYRVLGLSQADLETVQGLCECFLKHLMVRENAEKARLLAVIRKLPISQVLTAKPSPLISPATARVDKRRQRP